MRKKYSSNPEKAFTNSRLKAEKYKLINTLTFLEQNIVNLLLKAPTDQIQL